MLKYQRLTYRAEVFGFFTEQVIAGKLKLFQMKLKLVFCFLLLMPCFFNDSFAQGYVAGNRNDTLFSVVVNKELHFVKDGFKRDIPYPITKSLMAVKIIDSTSQHLKKFRIVFLNQGNDTITIENVVPFGISPQRPHITATGPAGLARSALFLPGYGPVGVILPDNAWELGLGVSASHATLCRRSGTDNSQKRRFHTDIFPEGKVTYTFWERPVEAGWREALKKFFQQDYLFDIESFNTEIYQRSDLQWIKSAYLIYAIFAWDPDFYDYESNEYKLTDYLKSLQPFLGKTDVACVWPTWPRLGLDERNQWDMYRNLPGGVHAIRNLKNALDRNGTKMFISYNPWDESTRQEAHLQGLSQLIQETDADGVVLDTQGSSSFELQSAADDVKSGVIMYSEGMAVAKDMPGIISGRVHDAIHMPPPLNLNRLIKPDFSIFRVCQIADGELHRDASIALFNGYGVEINAFGADRPAWMNSEFAYLGRVLRVLRENNEAFNDTNWNPLLKTTTDSVWVNHFHSGDKDIFTVLSFKPCGIDQELFLFDSSKEYHWVSIWRHEEVTHHALNQNSFIRSRIDPYPQAWANTRKEGNVDVLARFRELLKVRISSDSLFVSSIEGDKIFVWSGEPSYEKAPLTLYPGNHSLLLAEIIGSYHGKIVVQLFRNSELIDEKLCYTVPGTARRLPGKLKLPVNQGNTIGMSMVSCNGVKMPVSSSDSFIPYSKDSLVLNKTTYAVDIFPVTNQQFGEFVSKSGYKPADTTNYLRHWTHGRYAESTKNHPVVWISAEDAEAYAAWAGKRLPTEAEWQFAASGGNNFDWPWGNNFDSTYCNTTGTGTTAVNHFGEFAASPFGLRDLVGNVWQLMADEYMAGSYKYRILKGGSYWHPSSSWWYVPGGARPVHHRQMLLMVSPGFDRSSTVGFRCVKDIE